MPFDELKSDDAQSRLSRCRPVSGFRPSHCEDGKVMFAHNCGEALREGGNVAGHRRARGPCMCDLVRSADSTRHPSTLVFSHVQLLPGELPTPGAAATCEYTRIRAQSAVRDCERESRLPLSGLGGQPAGHFDLIGRKFLGLTPQEEECVHECLTWLRQETDWHSSGT